MTTVNEAVARVKDLGKQHVAVAIWCEDDVLSRAKELDIEVTREQAAMIIDYIDNHEDCDLGITWETIDSTLICMVNRGELTTKYAEKI